MAFSVKKKVEQRFRLRLARQDHNENYKFSNLRAIWRSHAFLVSRHRMPNDKLSLTHWNLLKRDGAWLNDQQCFHKFFDGQKLIRIQRHQQQQQSIISSTISARFCGWTLLSRGNQQKTIIWIIMTRRNSLRMFKKLCRKKQCIL